MRAQANGYEQRLLGIAEGFAGNLFKADRVRWDLILDIRIDGLAVLVITGAGLGGDGETLRHAGMPSAVISNGLAPLPPSSSPRLPSGNVNILFHLEYFLRFD